MPLCKPLLNTPIVLKLLILQAFCDLVPVAGLEPTRLFTVPGF